MLFDERPEVNIIKTAPANAKYLHIEITMGGTLTRILPHKGATPKINIYMGTTSRIASSFLPSSQAIFIFTPKPTNRCNIPNMKAAIRNFIGSFIGSNHKAILGAWVLKNCSLIIVTISPNQLPNIAPQNTVEIPQ